MTIKFDLIILYKIFSSLFFFYVHGTFIYIFMYIPNNLSSNANRYLFVGSKISLLIFGHKQVLIVLPYVWVFLSTCLIHKLSQTIHEIHMLILHTHPWESHKSTTTGTSHTIGNITLLGIFFQDHLIYVSFVALHICVGFKDMHLVSIPNIKGVLITLLIWERTLWRDSN